mmetsp:Transcript_82449/g.167120  ORF Transcript_82449/g.167120 Transcript_82449/m.167120 type:complete len:251 (+) Transcript_82449:1189-1941(+)
MVHHDLSSSEEHVGIVRALDDSLPQLGVFFLRGTQFEPSIVVPELQFARSDVDRDIFRNNAKGLHSVNAFHGRADVNPHIRLNPARKSRDDVSEGSVLRQLRGMKTVMNSSRPHRENLRTPALRNPPRNKIIAVHFHVVHPHQDDDAPPLAGNIAFKQRHHAIRRDPNPRLDGNKFQRLKGKMREYSSPGPISTRKQLRVALLHYLHFLLVEIRQTGPSLDHLVVPNVVEQLGISANTLGGLFAVEEIVS